MQVSVCQAKILAFGNWLVSRWVRLALLISGGVADPKIAAAVLAGWFLSGQFRLRARQIGEALSSHPWARMLAVELALGAIRWCTWSIEQAKGRLSELERRLESESSDRRATQRNSNAKAGH